MQTFCGQARGLTCGGRPTNSSGRLRSLQYSNTARGCGRRGSKGRRECDTVRANDCVGCKRARDNIGALSATQPTAWGSTSPSQKK